MKTLLTLSAVRLALLHASISASTFTQTGSNLRGSCLETRLASPRPIFTLTTQLIKENEDFVTVDNFFLFSFLFFFGGGGGTFYLGVGRPAIDENVLKMLK